MDKSTNALIRRIQKREDARTKARVVRLQRAMATHGRKFLSTELLAIEKTVEAAVGRVSMDR